MYELTARALRDGLDNPIKREQLIHETRSTANDLLLIQGLQQQSIDSIWQLVSDDYFLRYSGAEIAWHTELLSQVAGSEDPGFTDVRLHADGITAVIYGKRSQYRFAQATAALGQLGMTILDARISPIANGYSLDTYIFMELDKRTEVDESRLAEIRYSLEQVLTTRDNKLARVTRPTSRRAKMFNTKPAIDFTDDRSNSRTIMEMVAGDRPGLLIDIANTFVELGVNIENAKILTIGERAEDVFYITNSQSQPLDTDLRDQLRDKLMSRLDRK